MVRRLALRCVLLVAAQVLHLASASGNANATALEDNSTQAEIGAEEEELKGVSTFELVANVLMILISLTCCCCLLGCAICCFRLLHTGLQDLPEDMSAKVERRLYQMEAQGVIPKLNAPPPGKGITEEAVKSDAAGPAVRVQSAGGAQATAPSTARVQSSSANQATAAVVGGQRSGGRQASGPDMQEFMLDLEEAVQALSSTAQTAQRRNELPLGA
eukprot:TRINITY_DN16164_c0_g1_i1.p1 TRINITY_DN16164_c0_g1~~TRINITY_DN16164_c0_g1_i1.p1  ORF type:complete len:216 (-),score=39.49 TRINITY_DN16164_c0_g1_i1:286-933(-)